MQVLRPYSWKLFTLYELWNMFSAKIWFVKASTWIKKYESWVIKSNPAAQKIKILKIWNKYLEISSFFTCVPKIMIRLCTVPKIWCTTDGRTHRQKKWHLEVLFLKLCESCKVIWAEKMQQIVHKEWHEIVQNIYVF